MDIISFLYLIVGSIYGFLLFLRPKIASYILIILCIFQLGWFSRYYEFTDYLGRFIYFFAMLVAARILVDLFTKKISIKDNENVSKTIVIFLIGMIALTFVSNSYNKENFILGIYELRYYFVLTVLFFSIYYYQLLSLEILSFIKWLIFIALLQIPFAIMQFLTAGGGAFLTLDSVTGTFLSYDALILSSLLSLGTMLNYKFTTNKNIINISVYILSLILIIPLLLSKSRTGTGLVPFIIMFVSFYAGFRKDTKIDFPKVLSLMTVLVVFISLSFYFFFWKERYDVKTQFSINYVISYFMRVPQVRPTGETGEMGRARSIYEASRLIGRDPITILIGCGGGCVSGANFLQTSGRYYQDNGPLDGIGRTQISKIIAENGIIGILLFIYLFLKAWRAVKTSKHEPFLIKSNYIIVLSSLLLLAFYGPVLQFPYAALVLSYFFAVTQNLSKP